VRTAVGVIGAVLWFALNGLVWYSRPSDVIWLGESAGLGVIGFAEFFWYVTSDRS
jgi:hypothetical protein